MVLLTLDMQLKILKDVNKVSVITNLIIKGENDPVIEQHYRVLEERCIFYFAIIPFDYFPRKMVVHLMNTVVFYVNAFVWLKGVSETLSSLTIVKGKALDFNLHFRVVFGKFLQTHEGTKTDMILRATDAVELGPNGNL